MGIFTEIRKIYRKNELPFPKKFSGRGTVRDWCTSQQQKKDAADAARKIRYLMPLIRVSVTPLHRLREL